MKKFIDYFKKNSDKIGWILLVLLFVGMNVDVYFKLDASMESDFSSELVLAKILAQEKRLITTSWYYSTELRVVNSNVVSPILFLFTDNWHLVRILTIVIMELFLFAAYYYLAKKLKLKHVPWVGLLVVGAISYEYYKYALLCSSYIPHLAIAFATFGLIISIFEEEDKKKRTGKLIALLALAYAGGLESIRLMSTTYIPMVAAAVAYCFFKQFDNLKVGKFDFKDESVRLFVICLLGFIASFAGAVTNIFILPSLGYSYKLDTARINYTDINFDQLSETLSGWLKCLGYQSDNAEVLTLSQIILKPLFVVYFVLTIWSTVDILKNKEKYNWYERFIAIFFVVGFAILTLLFTFTTAWFKNRYLLPISIFSIILIGIFLSHYEIVWQKWTYIALLTIFVLYSTPYQIDFQTKYGSYTEFIQIKDILLENECYNGYCGDHWNGHNFLTELSDGKIETWVYFDNSIDNISEWLQAKDHKTRVPEGKTFIIQYKDVYYDGYDNVEFKDDVSKYICYEDDLRILYIFDSYEQLRSHLK